jgi:ribonucleoside-diphosphate reductase alpha chain
MKAFDEAMMILLCGTGVGFSVERQHIAKLPEVPDQLFDSEDIIVVHDSKEGWAKAYRKLVAMLYAGEIPKWDVSKVRPAGAKLKTFGGRASGPEPLVDLFLFTINVFQGAVGRRLNSIECHDIMCKIGDIVVVGGVRRSQRALANNSVVYTEKPDIESFMREWTALIESKSGERGIFARYAADKHVENHGRRKTGYEWGTNPCSEIILRNNQFCNLTEVVVRSTDTVESLKKKVRLATILGTVQSTFTKFPYLRRVWTKNTEEERLLGVSLTGIMDSVVTSHPDPEVLAELRQLAVDTNKEWAERLDIPQSAAITCVKPSGTVSQLVDAGSGIHARHSPYYIRTVRGDVKDPLTQLMVDEGVPAEPEVFHPDSTMVFSFPVKSPEYAVTRNDMSALEQLELWKTYAVNWCEHKPSVTISVRDEEWLEVGAWVYKNFDLCSGISFLPHSDHTYQQAPYQDCDEETYQELLGRMPKMIDWNRLGEYEAEDNTAGSQTLACTGGVCEVVDLNAA